MTVHVSPHTCMCISQRADLKGISSVRASLKYKMMPNVDKTPTLTYESESVRAS